MNSAGSRRHVFLIVQISGMCECVHVYAYIILLVSRLLHEIMLHVIAVIFFFFYIDLRWPFYAWNHILCVCRLEVRSLWMSSNSSNTNDLKGRNNLQCHSLHMKLTSDWCDGPAWSVRTGCLDWEAALGRRTPWPCSALRRAPCRAFTLNNAENPCSDKYEGAAATSPERRQLQPAKPHHFLPEIG